jgi:D-sedoheptulose 7-phosphate isomerase
MKTAYSLAEQIEERLLLRKQVFEHYFSAEARRLAEACREMAERFLSDGRLLAFGRGPYATDAQHVSVEFVHPVIVGKRALPALDLSLLMQPWLDAIVRPDDMVIGFGPPEGDHDVWAALQSAHARGAMTFALPGREGSYALAAATQDAFMHQEMVEILCHTLWETVHVFFEHRELGQDIGQTEFLYPFLGKQKQETSGVVDDVAASILLMKVQNDALLRTRLAKEESDQIAATAVDIHKRLQSGGKLILFGNGGSATDANDWAIDCVMPPAGYHAIPAISLAMEPATITAMANDVGIEAVFLRQMLAQAQPSDVIVAISTSGGSSNIVIAMEARKRNMMTVALLGNDGGEIYRRRLADHPIIVRSDYIPRIQEVQASTYHVLRETLEVLHHGDP